MQPDPSVLSFVRQNTTQCYTQKSLNPETLQSPSRQSSASSHIYIQVRKNTILKTGVFVEASKSTSRQSGYIGNFEGLTTAEKVAVSIKECGARHEDTMMQQTVVISEVQNSRWVRLHYH